MEQKIYHDAPSSCALGHSIKLNRPLALNADLDSPKVPIEIEMQWKAIKKWQYKNR